MNIPKSFTLNLQNRISNLLQKKSSSDVEFQVGCPPQQFFCHKVILSAGSPVFETMFFGTIRQNTPVCVPDVTAQGFQILLKYLYTDKGTFKCKNEALDAAYAAKKYMVKNLFALCEGYLLKHCALNPEEVFATFEEAAFLEMVRFQSHCLRYISRNAHTIFKSEFFRKASANTFQDILRLDLINVDTEAEIIEALWSWGKEQCKECGEDCSIENARKHTKGLLQHVRFLALNEDEITAILRKCQILDLAEEMALLRYLSKAAKPLKIPSTISKESKKRSIQSCTRVDLPLEYRYDGNMAAFLIDYHHTTIRVTVTGPPVTIVGFVVALKAIQCYSHADRFLEVEVSTQNRSSCSESAVKRIFKPKSSKDEEQHVLLLDNYILVEEQKCCTLTVTTSGEGVRIMQCTEDELRIGVGKSDMCLSFDRNNDLKVLFPIKQVMIV